MDIEGGWGKTEHIYLKKDFYTVCRVVLRIPHLELSRIVYECDWDIDT